MSSSCPSCSLNLSFQKTNLEISFPHVVIWDILPEVFPKAVPLFNSIPNFPISNYILVAPETIPTSLKASLYLWNKSWTVSFFFFLARAIFGRKMKVKKRRESSEEKVKPLNNLCHFIFNVTLLRQSWHMWTPRQAQTWRVKQGETMSPSLTQPKWYVQRLKEGNKGSLLGEGDANGTFGDPALGSASDHCFPEHSPLPVEWDGGERRLSKLAPKAT